MKKTNTKQEEKEQKNTFDSPLFFKSLLYQSNKERDYVIKKLQGEIVNYNILYNELKENILININELSLDYQSNEIVV